MELALGNAWADLAWVTPRIYESYAAYPTGVLQLHFEVCLCVPESLVDGSEPCSTLLSTRDNKDRSVIAGNCASSVKLLT
jgi:hypothetical protein